MARPHAITDHTTAIRHKSWAGKTDGRSSANPMVEIDAITATERRVLVAFKQALADYKTHKLSDLMLQSDIKALLAEVKLPHTKVRHILKNVPSEIAFFADPKTGNSYVVLKRAIVTNNEASTSGSAAHSGQASASTSAVRQDSRQLSASVPASSSGRASAGPSSLNANASTSASTSRQSAQPAPLFADDSDTTSAEEEEEEGTNSDASNSRHRPSSRTKQKEKGSTRRHSESTWGMQRPKEQQMHTKEVANATTSPQKRDRFAHPGPRKSAPIASSSSRSVSAPQRESDAHRRAGVNDESDEEDLLSAIRESQSVAPQEEARSLGEEEPLVLPVRKQPAPPSLTALRETAAGHGLDSHADGSFWADNGDAGMALDNDVGNDTLTPSFFENVDSHEDRYGEEIPFDQSQSQAQAGPSKRTLDGDEDDEDVFDLDMDTRRRSMSRSHHRTSSGGGSARKEVPDLLFDGYKATRSRGRSVRPGPPGMDEASTRDSSVQEAESLEDQEDLEDEKPVDLKPIATKRGPTKPGTVHKRSSDSSDSDTIVVTSKRAGAPPSKTREEREEERQQRQRDRQEREARKEARRIEKEALSKKKKKNPLPNFRNTQGQEAAELRAAYRTYLAELKRRKNGLESGTTGMHHEVIDLDADEKVDPLPEVAKLAEESASWTQIFSYESHKTKANRPDFNSVKFWPYNMPFPGRKRDEAIVAMAGGCTVRVFRLSEKRGITELWNVVDESIGWEKEELREVFYSCAWTHDVRREAGIAPHWRKWPILCVAGAGREVKVLDGYSGALLKVIQGHGGPIYSLAVHPSLPHVIATASGDEAISLWDISVPVSKPETAAGHGMLEELDKRRKGYTEGERLCVFGGYAGHVEAVLSISIHPSLPLLVSGGGDCKLRIWRIPDNLPSQPTSSLTSPTSIDPPEKSTRPPAFAFPIFTQTSLHSHHIDHVEWVGHAGHILTRSLCYDAPGKRVIRLFRPKFFDIFQNSLAKPPDVVGFEIDFGPQVELIARWTAPSCSGGIGDGIMCTATELVKGEDGKLSTRRRIYVPSIEPAMHIYDLDTKTKQPDLQELLQKYPFKLGTEILFEEDKRKNSVLKAADCQTAGRGWLVAVGEGEKITIWNRKDSSKWADTKAGVSDLLRKLKLVEDRDDSSEMDEDPTVADALPNGNSHANATTPEEEGDAREEPQLRSEVHQGAPASPLLVNGSSLNGSHLPSPPPENLLPTEAEEAATRLLGTQMTLKAPSSQRLLLTV